MTPEQVRWLTWGAIAHRPHNAPRWDEPGTAKAIQEVCGTWELPTATTHVLAHARDAKARTPYAIKGTAPSAVEGKAPRHPAKAGSEDECRWHRGEYADTCRACAADRLAGDTPDYLAPATTDPAVNIANLRALITERPTT